MSTASSLIHSLRKWAPYCFEGIANFLADSETVSQLEQTNKPIIVLFYFVALRIDLGASHMEGKYMTTEQYP